MFTAVVALAIATPMPMNPMPTPVASDWVIERLKPVIVTSPLGSEALLPIEAATVPVVEASAIAPWAPSRMPPPPATALA